jgi:hypothetical protein
MLKFSATIMAALFALSVLGTPAFSEQASGRASGKRQHKPLNVTKVIDKLTTVRTKVYMGAANTFSADNTQKWECTQTDKGFGGCMCKGANDCKGLIDSGKCKGKQWWEDGNDPSIGGCD